ncbi:hypothetical protein Scep_013486 [Stephania cephalantha]|uniref:E3 ubiquitin-protein ligase LIN n=1 Tax=Stephania cephalantha TaxID=152367 RepID=A0AAP0P7N7_9MAGN
MASLHELLSKEGFLKKKSRNSRLSKTKSLAVTDHESITLPIYICHDRKSVESFPRQKPKNYKSLLMDGGYSSALSSKRLGSKSRRSSSNITRSSILSDRSGLKDGVAIDDVAVRAVISILSGYVGRFLKDESFRETVREKCYSCMAGRRDSYCRSEIMERLELGIESIERLVEKQATSRIELMMNTSQNSIKLLSIVASLNLNSSTSKNGVPNSHLSACAQLYLSIVYKLEKSDRTSARHLLQVFCDSPFLARTLLLPDLWEKFFMPHLLHLKVWYNNEIESITDLEFNEKEERTRGLSKVYDRRMDAGTKQFALYYKEWLKADVAKPPPLPSVPLPSMPSKQFSKRRSSPSFDLQSPITKNLYRSIFGPANDYERRAQSIDIGNVDRRDVLKDVWDSKEEQQSGKGNQWRRSSQIYEKPKDEARNETQKLDYSSFFSCQSKPENAFIHRSQVTSNGIFRQEKNELRPSNLRTSIAAVCTSDNLNDCEVAIRVVSKAWLDSHGDPIVEASISEAPVIEGMLEVLFTSKDDEILELTISLLAELVSRNQVNRQIILNSDPQLEIFMRLLRSSSLFLKSSVLLYLLKPQAKQMLSADWIPLVLRVLEFGEQLQTLFTIQCSPQVAAFYLLRQLLTGFDDDRNKENARKVVSLGGLSLLVRRLDVGDHRERSNAVVFMTCCIQADGKCRYYLANHVKLSSILELLMVGNQNQSSGHALSLLTELLCLSRRSQITEFLIRLKSDEQGLNAMHILLVYLQRAPPEQRPLIAAILLQLDLLVDHGHYSLYKEEAVDAIIGALDCKTSSEKMQEQTARALIILGGHFSYTGESSTEKWLLKQAGFNDILGDSFHGEKIIRDDMSTLSEEDNATKEWQRKVTTALLLSGSNRLLTALSESLVKGLPCLARVSLITIAWMSSSMKFIEDASLHSLARSILALPLLETLNYDRQVEERVLASLSLRNLVQNTECLSKYLRSETDFIGHLRQLSLVTQSAEELLSIATSSINHRHIKLDSIPKLKRELKEF